MQRVPSAYLSPLIEGLLDAIPILLMNGSTSAEWLSDPWRFELRGDVSHNAATISVLWDEHHIAIRDAVVPLDQLAREIIRLSQKWLRYLAEEYPDEVSDPDWGQQYRQLEEHLSIARKAFEKGK
jgi:hypothetical protein